MESKPPELLVQTLRCVREVVADLLKIGFINSCCVNLPVSFIYTFSSKKLFFRLLILKFLSYPIAL